MSIYKKSLNIGFGIEKAKLVVIAVVIIAFAIFAFYSIGSLFSQVQLESRFAQNPWIQSENSSTLLFVKIVNTTGKDVKDSTVEVIPKSTALLVFPQKAVISETLAANDSRLLTFNIRRINPSEKLKPGKYSMTIKLSLGNEKQPSQSITLEVQ